MSKHETLYCFKLNKETGVIKKIEINDYESGKWSDKKQWYRFRLDSVVYYAYSHDFDRFKNDRVYSFNDSFDDAVRIIYNTIMGKRDYEYTQYKRHYDLMCNIANLYMNDSEGLHEMEHETL